jgi:hypothetical protein
MRLALVSSAWALGIVTVAFAGCSRTHDRTVQSRYYEPSAAEQRRIDERRAEERRAEERRVEERKADERRLEEARDDRSIGGGPNDPVLRATAASALASISTARCDREVRCKHVGAKEKYRTRATCVSEMQRDKRDDLNSDVCPGGIREKELTECLQSIREEDCGNPLDAISRLNACRTGSLCVK